MTVRILCLFWTQKRTARIDEHSASFFEIGLRSKLRPTSRPKCKDWVLYKIQGMDASVPGVLEEKD
ncbi:MAG: hypothetical protein AAB403_11370, partial [Planctomycetota bacterium]